MASVLQSYMRIIKKKMTAQGFVLYGQTFARISNDIMHVVTLKNFRLGYACIVEFGAIALCSRILVLNMGTYTVDKFYRYPLESGTAWFYDSHSKESIENCAMFLSEATEKYVLPFLDRCQDSKSTLQAIIELEELFEKNRQAALVAEQRADQAIPFIERSMLDHNKFYLALKAHEYGYVRNYLEFMSAYYERSLKDMHNGINPQPQAVVDKFTIAKNKYNNYLLELRSGNYTYFDNLIHDGEKQTICLFKSKYSKLYNQIK